MSSPLGHADSGMRRSTGAASPSVTADPLSLSAWTIGALRHQRSSVEQGGVLCRPAYCVSAVPGRERPPSRADIVVPASPQGGRSRPACPCRCLPRTPRIVASRSRISSAREPHREPLIDRLTVLTVNDGRFRLSSNPGAPRVAGAVRLSRSLPNRQGAPRCFARARARLTALTVRSRPRDWQLPPTTTTLPTTMTMIIVMLAMPNMLPSLSNRLTATSNSVTLDSFDWLPYAAASRRPTRS